MLTCPPDPPDSSSRSSSASNPRPPTPSERSEAQTPARTRSSTPFPAPPPGQFNNWKEDLFGDGLPFYDLLVSLDAHLDLFRRRTLDPLKHGWETRARPITEEWKARAKEAQLALEATFANHASNSLLQQRPASPSDNGGPSDSISFSSGFSLALSEAQKRTLRSSSERERELREFAERELREFREKLKIRREQIQTRWNDSKSLFIHSPLCWFWIWGDDTLTRRRSVLFI